YWGAHLDALDQHLDDTTGRLK
ncbi:MAG: hypothetical protein QOE41_4199, partial [Mycobacterium sp.]|nr:hypothetical protein [Mycobacterium sp.]